MARFSLLGKDLSGIFIYYIALYRLALRSIDDLQYHQLTASILFCMLWYSDIKYSICNDCLYILGVDVLWEVG